MRQEVEQEAELRRYLLGDLTLEEQVLIEERLFLDSEYAEVAQAVEDDLVDEFVHGDLTASEREKLGNHFHQRPEQKDNLRIAQALKKYLEAEVLFHPSPSQVNFRSSRVLESPEFVEQSPSQDSRNQDNILPLPVKRRPIVWLALAAAVLIVFSIIMWIGIQSLRRKGNEPPLQGKEIQPVQPSPNGVQSPGPTLPDNREERAQQPENPPNETPPNERREKPPQQLPAVLATIFPSGGSRGEGQTPKVTIPSELEAVTLRLPVILKSYDKYHFELLRDGRTIDAGDLRPQTQRKLGRVVLVTVSAQLLAEQSYEIKLRGLAGSGLSSEETTYSFTVEKEQ